MTAWMYYHNGGYPTVHSDYALSTRLSVAKRHDFPVFDPTDVDGKSLAPMWLDGFHPAGLCQKIVMLSGDVAFAWAGGLNSAQELECELRDMMFVASSAWPTMSMHSFLTQMTEFRLLFQVYS